MSAVDSAVATWLKSDALHSKTTNAAIPSGLLTGATDSEILSALSLLADADNENARQMALLNVPLALDEHTIKGARSDLLGKAITLTGDYLGYAAGIAVFVIGVEEQDDNTTILKVLRRLT